VARRSIADQLSRVGRRPLKFRAVSGVRIDFARRSSTPEADRVGLLRSGESYASSSLSGAAMEALIENCCHYSTIEGLRGLAVAEGTSLGPEGPSYSDADEKSARERHLCSIPRVQRDESPDGVARALALRIRRESSGSCSGGSLDRPKAGRAANGTASGKKSLVRLGLAGTMQTRTEKTSL